MSGGGSSRPRDGNQFPEEMWRQGDLDLRPEFGCVFLARAAGMVVLEEQFRGRALYATVLGDRSLISAEALLEVIDLECGSRDGGVKTEVACPPFDFFSWFLFLMHACFVLVGDIEL